MKIKLKEPLQITDTKTLPAGMVIEVLLPFGRELIDQGKAELVEGDVVPMRSKKKVERAVRKKKNEETADEPLD